MMLRPFVGGLVGLTLMAGSAMAQEKIGKVPVVAAGMQWDVDPESCQLTTPIEGKSIYTALTLTNWGIGDTISNYQLMLDKGQMKVPKQITLLANGSEPLAMPVSVPPYGPAGAIWFTAEEDSQKLAEKLDAGETVMLFTVFEMISLSPYGYNEAKEKRRECLTVMLKAVGINIADFYRVRGEDGHSAKGDIRRLFTSNDYPQKALFKGEHGTVRVTLVIDETGATQKCLVYKSSGSERLDQTTCDVLLERAKFEPAIDENGEPMPSLYVAPPISWQIG